LVEGEKLVGAVLASSIPVQAVYVGPGGEGPAARAAGESGVPVQRLAPGVAERVATTVNPQPVVAVATRPGSTLGGLRDATLVVVCVDVRDPGNLGAVVRSARAAGVGAVICCDGCADAWSPKAVRASAGALFHVQLVAGGAPVSMLEELGSWGMRRLGARASGGTAHTRTDLVRPAALVLGNEAHGLSAAVEAALDGVVTIPMAGGVESLNVGAAAAVLCFEAARQRCP
jgi:TrmH family RNA methyltransferase